MNILQISDGYGEIPGKGPLEAVLFNISKQMIKMGHEVTILERQHIETVPNIEYVDGIRIVRLDQKRANSDDLFNLNHPLSIILIFLDGIIFANKLIHYLRKHPRFDIIHAHLPFSSLFLIYLNRKVRDQIVYTAHGEEYRLNLSSRIKPQLFLRLFSPDLYLMKRVKKTVLLNEALRLKIISSSLVKSENIEVIPNGVDVTIYSSNKDATYVKNYDLTNGIKILFVGSITRRKGVEYLIKAANILVNIFNYKDIQFLLVGKKISKGPESDYLSKMVDIIKNFKLEKSVKLLGWVSTEELIRLYIASDIFVLPSLEEAFGLVITEAMASGMPVIGTNVGGIPMQIKNEWNGFLVNVMNEIQLAEKIKYLIDKPEERKRMGENSRKIVEEEFNWGRVAEEYLKVYREINKEDNY